MGMLDGKVAILTGAGRGIGAAAARIFAAEGALVVVSDLDSGPAEETVAGICNAGSQCISVSGDLTLPNFPSLLVEAAIETSGGLDIIVNNAGYPWDGLIETMDDEQAGARPGEVCDRA